MSTRASIKFTEEDETFFVYRHCDGNPEIILPDIQSVIEKTRRRWAEPEVGLLTTAFLGFMFDPNRRIQNYEITSCIHGDESYEYVVAWFAEEKRWKVTVL